MSSQWPQGKAVLANGKEGVEVKAEEVLGMGNQTAGRCGCDHPQGTLQVTDKHVLCLRLG